MKCDFCGSDMLIASGELLSEPDSTAVYSVLKMVCVNTKCDHHDNLKTPSKYKTEKRPANAAAFEEMRASGADI
jgi:hypothetical protein